MPIPGGQTNLDLELDLGYHIITFETDSELLARQAAERINAAVKAEFTKRRKLWAYSLELEIVAILPGSKRVVTKAKIKKTTWGQFTKWITPPLLALQLFGTGVANFDDLRDGAYAIQEELEKFYEFIIPKEPTIPPACDYKFEFQKPIDV